MTASDPTEREMRRDAALVPRGGAQHHPVDDVLDAVDPNPNHHDDNPDHVVGKIHNSNVWSTQK